MQPLEIALIVIVAGVCGALGKAISGFKRGGWLVSVALGFIGALLGVWLARKLELPELFTLKVGDVSFPIVWSIIGSAIFVAVLAFISRERK